MSDRTAWVLLGVLVGFGLIYMAMFVTYVIEWPVATRFLGFRKHVVHTWYVFLDDTRANLRDAWWWLRRCVRRTRRRPGTTAWLAVGFGLLMVPAALVAGFNLTCTLICRDVPLKRAVRLTDFHEIWFADRLYQSVRRAYATWSDDRPDPPPAPAAGNHYRATRWCKEDP